MKELHPGSVDNRKGHSKNMQIFTGQIPAVLTCEDLHVFQSDPSCYQQALDKIISQT